MRFPSIVFSTIQSTKREIAIHIINSTALILVYNLYMDSFLVLYPLLLSAAVLLVYLMAKGFSLASFYRRLEEAKTAHDDCNGDDALQTLVFEAISEIHRKYLSQVSRLHTQMNTRNTIFSHFFHDMKSSVSVIELACEKLGTTKHSEIQQADIAVENEKLKMHLEQALNWLRLDAFANDYIPERIDLNALVTRIINDHKRDFIYAGVFPKLNGEAFVHTDAKWCVFIIGQLISNAVKYSDSGANVMLDIKAFAKSTELCVTDCGIGIPPEDLPRVCDMFFTGANGRKRKASTGIGLFMVKHIADRLGIGLRIHSALGKGTTVTLSFQNLAKM